MNPFLLALCIALLHPSFAFSANLLPLPIQSSENKLNTKLSFELLKIYQQKNTNHNHRRSTHDASPGTTVLIDAVARENSSVLLEQLQSIGLQHGEKNGLLVSGILPIASLAEADAITSLVSLRKTHMLFQSGDVTTEGDSVLQADIARSQFKLDGSGITIGIISDSYNCLDGEAGDKAATEIPDDAYALEEISDCTGATDEGRALMQIIHDIAPAAKLIFHSGGNGTANTANGILEFAEQLFVDIIIDDFRSLYAPFFQYGTIAQAVNRAAELGVTYISAAGNSARNSYSHDFKPYHSDALDLIAHDFDPSDKTDILQRFSLEPGGSVLMVLQWSDPFRSVTRGKGALADLDLHVTNLNGDKLLISAASNNLGGDAIEILAFSNPENATESEFNFLINKAGGEDPVHIKYIIQGRFAGEILEYDTNSGTIYGHSNSPLAITTGASDYLSAPPVSNSAPSLEWFSSAGGTAIRLDINGNTISQATPNDKPDVIGPDNTNTSFFGNNDTDSDGLPNFMGTSAAAPHVAGVAALLLQSNPRFSPYDIAQLLKTTAIDINIDNRFNTEDFQQGYDTRSGYGFVNALQAITNAQNYTATQQVPLPSAPIEINGSTNSTGGGAGKPSLLLLIILLLIKLTKTANHTRLSLAQTSYSHTIPID